jgi:uncharacterized membrane protein YqjE
MLTAQDDRRRGVGALLRDLAEGSARLVRQQVRLARLELGTVMRNVTSGTMQVATGGVLTALGVIALVTGIILLIGEQWLEDHYWLAALIVTVVLGIVAALIARSGAALVSPKRLEPDQTLETLQEDKEWLKRRLTSGATSS